MKSIFTKLSTLLLCGAVAMVSCTDFSEDIQNLDNKVDNLGNTTQTELATLQKAITDLEAKLAAQYATKDEVAALKTALENSIASEVDALSKDIADVNAALKAAEDKINGAIADLDDKKADKTAVDAAIKTATEAIAALQSQLEAAKGELEAEIDEVKAEIAATEEELAAQIGAVDAKANELHNTLLALSDYLANLEAKVNELKGTLDALSEYLPKMKAELEEKINDVDAKAIENFNTLLALSDHLAEYEATTDFKLVELQGSLAALSVYLEEYEASVDAKFKEILNTFDSLDGFLDEKFAALEATDTDLYKEIEGVRVVLTALNNLLTDEAAARMAEDNALYELIGTSVTALNNLIADLEAEDQAIYAELDGVRQAFTTLNNLLDDEVADRTAEDAAIYELIGTSVTALNNLIADLEAEDDAIYVEMENIRTYIAQVYNSLSYEIQAVDAALKAHVAAFEAFKEAYEAKVDELEATDENLYVEINGLREVITTINNHIEDLKAEDTAIYAEINGVRENLTQLQNAINNRIDEEVKDLKADILEKFNILNTVILETEKRVNDKFNHTLKLIAENAELILANAAAIADLEAAVEMLMDWAAGQEENNELQAELIAKVYEIVGEMEEQITALTQKDNELEGLIGKTAGALQTYMDENNERLAALETYTKENVNLLGTGIRNLEAIINDLEARFGARLDALEERMDAAEDKIADLEDQAAEMSEAIVNIEAAIEDLEAMDEALAAEIANVDAAAKKALKEAREELQDQIDALVKAKEDLEARVKVLEELVAANEDAIEDNRAEIEANIKAISNAVKQLGSLQATVNAMIQSSAIIDSALQAKDIELQKNIDAAVADLAAAVSRITAVEQSIEAIYALAETLATKEQLDNATADLTAKIEREIATLQGQLVAYIAQNGANIADIRTELLNVNALIKELRGDVNDLLARVQSLVYVPDYDDHKATISWAELLGGEPQGILVKKSVLRYRVYAKADEDAVAAAKAIENAWTPESFYYEVEPVKRAWTRSATVPASLEITDVWAEGEYLNVEVLAKNFNPEFFFSDWYGDNYPRVAMENKPEEGKPVDEKSSYSVSLVLTDGNNNRSTEYTNLVPAHPEVYWASVLDGEDNNITYREYEDAPVAYLPYDRAEPNEEAVVLEGHRLAFYSDSDGKYMSADELIAAGYDIQLTRRVNQIQLNTGEKQYHEISPIKPEVREVGNFSITERPFEGITKENDTYAWITKEMTKAEYLALKEKEQNVLTIDYIYNVNGVEVNTEASVEICNRLVEVNLSVDIPWTLETAISTIADSKMYEGPVAATFEYDLAKAANKSLEGYSLYSIIHADDVETSYVPKCPISLSVNDKTVTATLKHGSKARYEFPANNNDDVVDYNTYVVTKKAEFDDLTVTVNVKVNLGEQPKTQEISKDVTFTTASGANGWLFGYWNALEDAYQKFLEEGYIGYVDAPETGKAKFFEAFAYDSSYGNMGDPLMVNQKAGIPQNVNVPFTKNNNENGEHRFQLWHEQLNVNEDGYVDGTEQTIVQKVKPYFLIPFIFTVNGTVDMPDYALDIDPVRVVEGVVDVKGEIAGGVYTVDVSDLAKYYYVVNESGTKSLEAVNEGDVLTVDFELSAMEGAEEDGFNFNNVADQTEYSLNVDWTSSEPYILPMGKAVAMWGTYPHTEVEVNAVLKVNGFPVVSKPITLVTQDPLEIALNDVTVEVTHLSGTNPDPIVAKVYQNFVLTSAVEEGNLFNNAAKTIGGLWYYSHADVTYGVTMDLKFNRVYYKVGEEQIGWDESKIVLEKYTAENLVAPYEVGDLTGNLYIKPDDGDIKTPIYVEFNVNMTHNIHNAAKTKCETSGIVTVKFVPEGYVEVAE